MKGNLINDLLKLMLIAVSIILVCIGVIFVSDKMSAKETSITTVYKSQPGSN